MGINQRVSLRKFAEDIRRWVEEGRSDEWIASALGTSPSSVQSFRSRNGIYRRGVSLPPLREPGGYSSYEGALETEGGKVGIWFDPSVQDDPRWRERWDAADRIELHLSPKRIVILRARNTGGAEEQVRQAVAGL
jgi:hypothetical protein